jgi:FHA domain
LAIDWWNYLAVHRAALAQWWIEGARNAGMINSARPVPANSADCVPWIEDAVNNPTSKSRLLLWIDAVGGFLVCLGNQVRLGQAVLDSTVDVPLLADLSRHHATIRRDEEGYTIEPLRETWLNHERITANSWIHDGSLIRLGPALELRFRRPHPLSATARLDYVSHHRSQPSSSAVLLMADTCVLGPAAHNHVVCRHWPHDVVLHRQHGSLYCTSATPIEVDGQRYAGRAPLNLHSRVDGEGFSFSLEEI